MPGAGRPPTLRASPRRSAVAPYGVAALPIGEATARGVSEGVLAHDAHNSYHYADAGRLYELEMLLNAFSIASRRQP